MMHYRIGRQRGFTLAELMIAVALGLLIVAGMTTLFVNNNRAQAAVENASRQVENGRYAMQVLSSDLRNAGFYGEFDPTVLPFPAAIPDPCSTDMDAVKAALKLPLQGVDNALPTALDCLSGLKSGTDILVVRHAGTCVIGAADCDTAADGGPFLQASLCNNVAELNSGDPNTFFGVAAQTSSLTLTRRDCSTVAAIRRLQVHIYFIATYNETGDGMPTLKRAELVSADGVVSFNIVPLVEGIENLQLEYGLDTSVPTDGVANVFVTDPAIYNSCNAPACANTNWEMVQSARISLLARNTLPTAGYTNSRSYTLGSLTDGSRNIVAAANDNYKRHVFQALVSLPNAVGRKLN
ncbi:MAG TPA: PilW family protein [Telluria sp.]|nr:PilW family protein [Telluria sp.]